MLRHVRTLIVGFVFAMVAILLGAKTSSVMLWNYVLWFSFGVTVSLPEKRSDVRIWTLLAIAAAGSSISHFVEPVIFVRTSELHLSATDPFLGTAEEKRAHFSLYASIFLLGALEFGLFIPFWAILFPEEWGDVKMRLVNLVKNLSANRREVLCYAVGAAVCVLCEAAGTGPRIAFPASFIAFTAAAAYFREKVRLTTRMWVVWAASGAQVYLVLPILARNSERMEQLRILFQEKRIAPGAYFEQLGTLHLPLALDICFLLVFAAYWIRCGLSPPKETPAQL